MQFETIGGIPMGNLRLEVCRQVYNIDGTEWTFLYANTTSDAKALGNEGNFRLGGDLYAELARPYNGA